MIVACTAIYAASLAPGPTADPAMVTGPAAEAPPTQAHDDATDLGSASESPVGSDPEPTADAAEDAGPSPNADAISGAGAQPPVPIQEEEPPPSAGAIGGLGHTPLPPAPPRRDASTLETRPWRGRGWFDLRLDLMIPVAGVRPARGNVVSAAGGFNLGWRIGQSVGVYTGLSTFVHDEEVRTTLRTDGSTTSVQGVGRTVIFDLAVLRLWLPVGKRIQPWADVGGGVGVYRAAFSNAAQALGHARVGAGVDFWLAQTFSLSLGSAYRLLSVDRTLGHAVQVGLEFGLHW